jgi:phosphoribosyl 1,2-cyclic phosphate phosphodiesterase
MTNIKITFLGSGTSHGVPMIGCNCEVCQSDNPRNKRLRSSILVEDTQKNRILIDCSKDFREQALKYKIDSLEHILVTHLHADHIFGIDELRVYNRITGKSIKLYLSEEFNKQIRDLFPYIYNELDQIGGGVTSIENMIISPNQSFKIDKFKITPIPVYHGKLPIFGYKINKIAYLTDCSLIPEESFKLLQDLDILILDALRIRKHPTHFSLDEAIETAQKIKAKQTYFTHMAHDLNHDETNATLPQNMQLAYDGLVLQ